MVAVNKVLKTREFQKKSRHALRSRPYDIILLDLDMPILNGFDACAKIRNIDQLGLASLL